MSKEPFANLPDVLNAKQLAEALHLSKAGAYTVSSWMKTWYEVYAENRREEAGHKAGFIALAEKTHQQSRAEKNRKQPITTARTHYSLSEQFLFENRRFSQVKSREKEAKKALLA